MAHPKRFWIVFATCIFGITCSYYWNVWYDNTGRANAQMKKNSQGLAQQENDAIEKRNEEMRIEKHNEEMREGCRQYLGLGGN